MSRFKELESKLTDERGIKDPAALAAWIGRKKYGSRKFTQLAEKGREREHRRKSMANALTQEELVALGKLADDEKVGPLAKAIGWLGSSIMDIVKKKDMEEEEAPVRRRSSRRRRTSRSKDIDEEPKEFAGDPDGEYGDLKGLRLGKTYTEDEETTMDGMQELAELNVRLMKNPDFQKAMAIAKRKKEEKDEDDDRDEDDDDDRDEDDDDDRDEDDDDDRDEDEDRDEEEEKRKKVRSQKSMGATLKVDSLLESLRKGAKAAMEGKRLVPEVGQLSLQKKLGNVSLTPTELEEEIIRTVQDVILGPSSEKDSKEIQARFSSLEKSLSDISDAIGGLYGEMESMGATPRAPRKYNLDKSDIQIDMSEEQIGDMLEKAVYDRKITPQQMVQWNLNKQLDPATLAKITANSNKV